MSDFRIIVPFSADDLNEATNPSLELNTTGWSSSGTFAQSAEQQWRGRYSGKITVPASTTLASYAITLATQNTTYYLRAWAHVASNWNGGNISLNVASLSGSSVTVVKQFTSGTDPFVTFIELESTLTVATDVTGSITLVSSSTPSAGRIVYIDALYVSTNNGEYFDGDDEMAYWTGNRHASTSKMDFRNRAHGNAYDPETTGVKLGFPTGVDFASIANSMQMRALGHGAEFQNTYVNARAITFPVIVPAGSETQYHSRKKAFENLIKFNRSPGEQPFILQYLGANSNVPVYVKAKASAFDITRPMPYSGKGILQLDVADPHWYETGDKYLSLTRSTSLSVSYILGWLNDGTGFSNLGNTGTGWVYAVEIAENRDAYMGGDFLNWDANANADYLVRYNRSTGTWSALFGASPPNGIVHEIITLDDGDLVFVGEFTTVGGVTPNRAARWDGTTVTAFGTGFNGAVYAVSFDYKRGKLYFGGAFTTANGVAHNRVVQYDLTTGTFSAMQTGFGTSTVLTLWVDQPTGDVFAGGDFTVANTGPLTVNRIARWDYSEQAWKVVGPSSNPGTNGNVNAIVSDGTYIYFGGAFTTAGGDTVNNIAKIAIGSTRFGILGNPRGVNSTVSFLYWDKVLNKLLIGGPFSVNSNLTLKELVYWNGTTYEPSGIALPGTAENRRLEAFARHPSGDYYYGGRFSGTVVVPSALNTITNAGTTDTYPVFYFDSIGTAIGTENARLDIIANRTTGRQINFNGLNLIEGTRIIVDTLKQKVYRVVGQDIIDITAGVVRRDSDWSDFTLVPGVNEIMISAPDVTGTPTITAYMLYRHRHHSLSGSAP